MDAAYFCSLAVIPLCVGRSLHGKSKEKKERKKGLLLTKPTFA